MAAARKRCRASTIQFWAFGIRLLKTFKVERISTFFVVSIPVAQWTGNEGWQQRRAATGIVCRFNASTQLLASYG
jgi:hypothetical protein